MPDSICSFMPLNLHSNIHVNYLRCINNPPSNLKETSSSAKLLLSCCPQPSNHSFHSSLSQIFPPVPTPPGHTKPTAPAPPKQGPPPPAALLVVSTLLGGVVAVPKVVGVGASFSPPSLLAEMIDFSADSRLALFAFPEVVLVGDGESVEPFASTVRLITLETATGVGVTVTTFVACAVPSAVGVVVDVVEVDVELVVVGRLSGCADVSAAPTKNFGATLIAGC